jgi:hypothetical protein
MHLRTASAPNRLTSPWPYFLLALGWSWLFWLPVVFAGMDIAVAPGIVLFILGILGPSVSGILLTYLTGDQQERREYWRRLTSFRRIKPRWYASIILITPVGFYEAVKRWSPRSWRRLSRSILDFSLIGDI